MGFARLERGDGARADSMDAVRLSGPAAASDASPSRSTTALDLRLLTIFGAVGLKQPRPVTSSPAAGFADAVELSKDVWRSRGNVVSMSSDAASSESPSWGGRGGWCAGVDTRRGGLPAPPGLPAVPPDAWLPSSPYSDSLSRARRANSASAVSRPCLPNTPPMTRWSGSQRSSSSL